jgi:hypothetical protein
MAPVAFTTMYSEITASAPPVHPDASQLTTASTMEHAAEQHMLVTTLETFTGGEGACTRGVTQESGPSGVKGPGPAALTLRTAKHVGRPLGRPPWVMDTDSDVEFQGTGTGTRPTWVPLVTTDTSY